jgi:[protein-PII] uridylyltransferase
VEVPGKALRLHAEKSFFDLRKVTEKRHERYGKSVSLLEPNVKEGKGGLRDFHVLRWLLWPLEGVSNSWDRVAGDMIPGRLSEDLQDALRFLWKVRLVLHMLVRRKNDRLTFQFQEEIALHLGYRQKGHTLDVEVFMRDYYEKATAVSRVMALAFEKLSWKDKPPGFSKLLPVTRRVSRDFVLKHGKLEAMSRGVFVEAPAKVISAFQIAARYGVDVGWQTREYITRAMESSSRGIRTDAAALHAFLKIFKKGRRIADTLIQMNRIKLLGYLLPEFENIYCRVQHDAYHVYTVDVHSIFTVAEIEKLKDIRLTENVYNRGFLLKRPADH